MRGTPFLLYSFLLFFIYFKFIFHPQTSHLSGDISITENPHHHSFLVTGKIVSLLFMIIRKRPLFPSIEKCYDLYLVWTGKGNYYFHQQRKALFLHYVNRKRQPLFPSIEKCYCFILREQEDTTIISSKREMLLFYFMLAGTILASQFLLTSKMLLSN